MKIRAFILAAGYGTRLRPLTNFLPKPLLPLLGKPLLYYILKNLIKNKVIEIGINLHHLGEKIEVYLRESSFFQKITLFYEREILGTGGALKNAESFLREASFLVHNGDVWTNFELIKLLNFHKKEKPLATLLVLDNPRENKLYLDEKGRLLGIEGYLKPQKFIEKVCFSGIAIYEPEIFKYLEKGFSSVVSAWIKALEDGKVIRTLKLEGAWFDLGSFTSYGEAISFFLKERGERVFFHPQAEVEELEYNGFVSIESRTLFKRGSFLRNVVVLAQDRVVSDKFEEGILVGDSFIPIERKKKLEEISLGGSERKFFRKSPNLVLMKASSDEEEFKRTYKYNLFLKKRGLKVPNIKRISLKKREIIFEDLGDLSLYNWLKGKKNLLKIENKYKEVIEEIIKLHTLKIRNKKLFASFDFAHFRWESSYFEEKFIEFLCKLKSDLSLKRELDELALLCDNFPKNLIHRDFQSQNIILKEGEPYLIDYQSAKLGPPGYDLASLLWDPYYQLEDSLRKRLLEYYIQKRKERDKDFDERKFCESLPYLCVQRHMQAAAAYINLAYFKGKKYFLKFLPQTLDYLFFEVEKVGLRNLKVFLEKGREILKKSKFYEELEEISL